MRRLLIVGCGDVALRMVALVRGGVYGDCNETRPTCPQTDRARRRADGERRLREWGAPS